MPRSARRSAKRSGEVDRRSAIGLDLLLRCLDDSCPAVVAAVESRCSQKLLAIDEVRVMAVIVTCGTWGSAPAGKTLARGSRPRGFQSQPAAPKGGGRRQA